MFTYYLCKDDDTIYHLEFSIKPEEREHFLSLFDNYLNERVLISENTVKKILEEGKIEGENQDTISIDNDQLLLEKTEVLSTEKIADGLPFVVTIKQQKYSFLRSYTVCALANLFSNDMTHSGNPLAKKIADLPGRIPGWYVDFQAIYKLFFGENESSKEESCDYRSLKKLLGSLDAVITESYSANELNCFWAGDDAERDTAEGIVRCATSNKVYLKKFTPDFFPIHTKY